MQGPFNAPEQFGSNSNPIYHANKTGTNKTQLGTQRYNYLYQHTNGTPKKDISCWPPTGKCTSCGFEAQKRLGTLCIARGKICVRCRSPGHIDKACRRRSTLHSAERGEQIDVTAPDIHTGKGRNQDDQTKADGGVRCLRIDVSNKTKTDNKPAVTIL